MSDPSRSQTANADAVDVILLPALRVGLASAGVGFLIGGTSGILKDTTPVLFGIASFIQCGTLGTTFWASRTALLRSQNKYDNATRSDLTAASAAAGGISGGFAGLIFRGPRSMLPGIICMSFLGGFGQAAVNYATQERVQVKKGPGLFERLSNSSWSPMQPITDKEHADKLRDKLLKVEVEIAVLDDKIAALKVLEQQSKDNPS